MIEKLFEIDGDSRCGKGHIPDFTTQKEIDSQFCNHRNQRHQGPTSGRSFTHNLLFFFRLNFIGKFNYFIPEMKLISNHLI
jgi:hypothetical protein